MTLRSGKQFAFHLGVLGVLLLLHFVLPPYHHSNLARIMVLAVFAMGYNISFGYTGLLSLGHALFFAAGMYGCALLVHYEYLSAGPAWIVGLLAGGAMAAITGLLALRTTGVAFMIVTLMFAQAGYLTLLYFGNVTRGDEGIVIDRAARVLGAIDLSADNTRYLIALGLFSVGFLVNLSITRAPIGRVLIAMRENQSRSQMLGFDPFRYRLIALIISGAYAGAAGAAYGILFGYVGASFASIQYSILPMLWVLLGGAGIVLGPFLGTLIMFYLIDIASSVTDAHLLVVGLALVALVLFAPRGLLGVVRERLWPWLP